MSSNAPSQAQQDAPAAPVAPGTLLANKYRVERILGRGGMGYVVEAKHVALDERVALKFLLPEYAQHPEAATRFLREARAAVKIKSEHVARVSDVGTLDSGAPYMVMEFLHGTDLAQLLAKQGVLAVEDAVDYILQACEAIAEAHSHGIVHRDLKPANLFLAKRIDGTPLVKVLDFGISKMTGGGDHALTRTSTAMGSALYMSPEQMQETRGVDHRTDIYSLGIALFELLAGKQPFYAETLPQLCAEVLTGTPKPIGFYRNDVPPELAMRMERAYERDKSKRYQSVGELVVSLAPWAPARSQGTIDRVARMSGLEPPLAGSAYGPAPARAQLASRPSYTHGIASTIPVSADAAGRPSQPLIQPPPPPMMQPPPPPLAQAPLQHAPTGPLPNWPQQATPSQAAPQGSPKTVPLPVMGDAAPEPNVAAATTNQAPPTGFGMQPDAADAPRRIEPGAYQGPRSAAAAAAFAGSAKAQPPAGRTNMLVVALAIGAAVGIGGGVLVYMLRDKSAHPQDTAAQGPITIAAPSATTPGQTAPERAAETAEKPQEPSQAASAAAPPGTAASAANAAPQPQPSASAIPSATARPGTNKTKGDLFERR